jgi:hypothetical protein
MYKKMMIMHFSLHPTPYPQHPSLGSNKFLHCKKELDTVTLRILSRCEECQQVLATELLR